MTVTRGCLALCSVGPDSATLITAFTFHQQTIFRFQVAVLLLTICLPSLSPFLFFTRTEALFVYTLYSTSPAMASPTGYSCATPPGPPPLRCGLTNPRAQHKCERS